MLRRAAKVGNSVGLWGKLAPALEALGTRWNSPVPQPYDSEHFQPRRDTFKIADLELQLRPTKDLPALDNPKFGSVFTDHMLVAEHQYGAGWTRPLIRPLGALSLHPAAQVLHYGMTCFEGMKAYRGADGRPRLFRPEKNMERLARSAARLQLAPFDPSELLACIKALVKVDSRWLPTKEGHSLYIRPSLFASSPVLGVAKATHTTLSVLMSPVGPYFPSGIRPVALFVEERATRAWPGGVGAHKVGGNYAPTILPQMDAARDFGAAQVVYTFRHSNTMTKAKFDPDDAEFEECGAMNVFFVLEKSAAEGGKKGLELVTPDLTRGTILPGITRDSILSLARGLSSSGAALEVSERRLTVREVRAAARDGRLREVFGSGTACIVQPVSALVRASGEVFRPTVQDPSQPEAMAPQFQRALLDIQYGRVPDHPWSVVVD